MADSLYHLRTRYWNDVKPPRDALPDLEHRLAQGLIADWNMTEGEGLLAFDRSGRGNHGTLENGPTWVAGDKGGAALEFDGAGDNVNLGNIPIVEGFSELTIVARIRPDFATTEASNRFICDKSLRPRLYFYAAADDFDFQLATESGTGSARTAGLTWTPGTWHQIVARYDGAKVSIWWDSVFKNEGPATGLVTAISANFRIGSAQNQSTPWLGAIDQVAIRNAALTADDIAQLFSEPYAYYPRPRRFWYTSTAAVGVYPIIGGDHVIQGVEIG